MTAEVITNNKGAILERDGPTAECAVFFFMKTLRNVEMEVETDGTLLQAKCHRGSAANTKAETDSLSETPEKTGHTCKHRDF